MNTKKSTLVLLILSAISNVHADDAATLAKELTKEEEEKLQYKKQENILFLDEETKINITQLANFQA